EVDLAEPANGVGSQRLVEPAPVDDVDGCPRPLAAVDLVHARPIGALPVVEERLPVACDTSRAAQRAQLIENAPPPVDQRPVRVTCQRPDLHAASRAILARLGRARRAGFTPSARSEVSSREGRSPAMQLI